MATGLLQAKRTLGHWHEFLVPTMVELVSVRQRLGQQDAAYVLLLEAAFVLSGQGPESLSSACPSDC